MTDLVPDGGLPHAYQEHSQTLSLTPEEAAQKFQWADYLTSEARNRQAIGSFRNKTKDSLGLDPNTILGTMDKVFELGSKVVAERPKDKNLALTYHNETHTKITAVVSTSIFLGKLAKIAVDQKYKKHFDDDPELATRLVNTQILIATLHEVDDWWNIGCSEDQLKEMRAIIQTALPDFGLGQNDFNRLIILDDFVKPLEDVLNREALPGKIANPFFRETDGESPLLDYLKAKDEAFAREIFMAFGSSIRAADFMQILNPAYMQPVNLKDSDGKTIKKAAMGQVALAEEMGRLRGNALVSLGWGQKTDDGTAVVDWQKVDTSDYFINEIARPNIEGGIHDLAGFNPGEHANALKFWKAIQKAHLPQ